MPSVIRTPVYNGKAANASTFSLPWRLHHHHAPCHLWPRDPVALMTDSRVHGVWRLAIGWPLPWPLSSCSLPCSYSLGLTANWRPGNTPARSQCRTSLMRVVLYSMASRTTYTIQVSSCWSPVPDLHVSTPTATMAPVHEKNATHKIIIAWWPMSVVGMDGPCPSCMLNAKTGTTRSAASWWPWLHRSLRPWHATSPRRGICSRKTMRGSMMPWHASSSGSFLPRTQDVAGTWRSAAGRVMYAPPYSGSLSIIRASYAPPETTSSATPNSSAF